MNPYTIARIHRYHDGRLVDVRKAKVPITFDLIPAIPDIIRVDNEYYVLQDNTTIIYHGGTFGEGELLPDWYDRKDR